MAIPIGLTGSEQALQGGLQGSLQSLDIGNRGINRQAALAGLRGNKAQGRAFQNFQDSPGQQFLRDQGQRSILAGASATGGLGGGNVQRELAKFGTGLAAQDFNNQFQRGQQVLGSQQGPASQAANFAFNTGGALAQGRTGAAQQIAGNQANTTSALANLINQQGAGASDIIGGSTTNIANLLQGSGATDAATQQQLAQLLSNLAVQQGTQSTGQTSPSQFLNNQGILGGLGQAAGGIGGGLEGLVAAGIIGSDRRLKENIKKIGQLPNGLNLYTWTWKKGHEVLSGIKMTAGVMAQEVLELMPEAVVIDKSGYYKVNYGMIL